MEMNIADDTDEGLFVGFDGEMKKLHNMRAYEAVHLMVRHHKTTSHIFDTLCFTCLQLIRPTQHRLERELI